MRARLRRAPIRHTDHVVGADEGGATSYANCQGLCEGCNHAKDAPGWRARPGPEGEVETTTPTGLTYRSSPPGQPPPALPGSRAEFFLADLALVS